MSMRSPRDYQENSVRTATSSRSGASWPRGHGQVEPDLSTPLVGSPPIGCPPINAPAARSPCSCRHIPRKDAAAVGFHDAPDESQPEAITGPLGRPDARRIGSYEGLEGSPREALSEAWTAVAHDDASEFSCARDVDLEGLVGRMPVRARVDEEV